MENYLWKIIVYGKYTAANLVCTSALRCEQEWSEDRRALAPPAPALGRGFSSSGSHLGLGALGSPPPHQGLSQPVSGQQGWSWLRGFTWNWISVLALFQLHHVV